MSAWPWWLWLLGGSAMLLAELRLGTWLLFCFGLAAWVVALFSYLSVASGLNAQYFLWIVAGVTFMWTRTSFARQKDLTLRPHWRRKQLAAARGRREKNVTSPPQPDGAGPDKQP